MGLCDCSISCTKDPSQAIMTEVPSLATSDAPVGNVTFEEKKLANSHAGREIALKQTQYPVQFLLGD